MRVIAVTPGQANSASLEERARPEARPDRLMVQALALGICGTDHEILSGRYGAAPEGAHRLVLGHESLGRVVSAPAASGFATGDHVVGVVRRPDPVPCPACGAGEWDMCRNGLYQERGIRGLDGYGAEIFSLDPGFAVRVDAGLGLGAVLLEPASILAKAWDHIERIGHRTRSWAPRRVLVTGAGPVGLLAAMMGRQRGLEVHVIDRIASGPKPRLVAALGAIFHPAAERLPVDLAADIVIECTGAPDVVLQVLQAPAPGGVVCLTGVSAHAPKLSFDAGAFNRDMVLENDVVFGSVNANLDHYQAAARALAAADPAWLAGVITRRVPLADWRQAFERRPDDVKVVITFEAEDGWR